MVYCFIPHETVERRIVLLYYGRVRMGSLQGYRQELYDGGGLGIPTRGTRFPIKGARLLIVQKLAFGNEWSQVDFFPNGG